MDKHIEIANGKILKVFSTEETLNIEKKWMSVFCKQKQGLNTKQFKWHIFSGGRYPSITGEASVQEYSKQYANEYILLANNGNLAILTNTKPFECNISDFYVFPHNMAWTMAFTHEDGWLGPYFALHPNYKSLNAINEKHKDKLQQIGIAKKNGWY